MVDLTFLLTFQPRACIIYLTESVNPTDQTGAQMTSKPSIDRAAVLSWFTGKGLEKATVALEQVMASVEQGFWTPGVSRSAMAVLSKSNVAATMARNNRWIGEMKAPSASSKFDSGNRGFPLHMALSYGFAQISGRTAVDFSTLLGWCSNDVQVDVITKAQRFWNDMAPLALAFKALDATRPPPVFTSIGLSPSVTATMQNAQMDAGSKIEMCPVRFEEQERTIKGKVVKVMVGILLWPEGTKHNCSRYSYGTDRNLQCHACGHAIRNPGNWVPLILTGKDNVPRSFWVGKDCAGNIFGVNMKGEAEWSQLPSAGKAAA